jgi:hypothetical protein
MRYTPVLIVPVVLWAACGRSASSEKSPARNIAADSTIYAVLLDSLRGTGDSVLVAQEFDDFPDSAAEVPRIAAWVHKQLPAADSALIAGLAASRYPGSISSIVGPVGGVRWFADLRQLGQPNPFPQYRVVSFTRIAYDLSRTRAVVYASMGCGALCGNGSFYAFQFRNGIWLKVGQVVRVIS